MILRAIQEQDIEQIRKIHDKYYKDEFSEIDFRRHFLCAFVIEEDGEIITAGGVRTILEAVAVTNKEFPSYRRMKALLKMLDADLHFASCYNYEELHVFLQDEDYMKRVIKRGFHPTKGNALVIGV